MLILKCWVESFRSTLSAELFLYDFCYYHYYYYKDVLFMVSWMFHVADVYLSRCIYEHVFMYLYVFYCTHFKCFILFLSVMCIFYRDAVGKTDGSERVRNIKELKASHTGYEPIKQWHSSLWSLKPINNLTFWTFAFHILCLKFSFYLCDFLYTYFGALLEEPEI